MLWFMPTCTKATAGSLKMPRKSVILTRCSPLSCASFSKLRAKFSEYQAATSGSLDGLGQARGSGEFGVDGRFEEAHFGPGDVAHQVDGGSGTGIGAVVRFAGGARLEEFFCGAGFVVSRGGEGDLRAEMRRGRGVEGGPVGAPFLGGCVDNP